MELGGPDRGLCKKGRTGQGSRGLDWWQLAEKKLLGMAGQSEGRKKQADDDRVEPKQSTISYN